MTRSGMAAILRAVLYSGFFWKSDEFSRVETSSERRETSAERVGEEDRERNAFVCLFELRL